MVGGTPSQNLISKPEDPKTRNSVSNGINFKLCLHLVSLPGFARPFPPPVFAIKNWRWERAQNDAVSRLMVGDVKMRL